MKTTPKTISLSEERYAYLLSLEEKLGKLSNKFLSVSTELAELKRIVFGSKSERFVPNTDANYVTAYFNFHM